MDAATRDLSRSWRSDSMAIIETYAVAYIANNRASIIAATKRSSSDGDWVPIFLPQIQVEIDGRKQRCIEPEG